MALCVIHELKIQTAKVKRNYTDELTYMDYTLDSYIFQTVFSMFKLFLYQNFFYIFHLFLKTSRRDFARDYANAGKYQHGILPRNFGYIL